jgi:hypothetical protein
MITFFGFRFGWQQACGLGITRVALIDSRACQQHKPFGRARAAWPCATMPSCDYCHTEKADAVTRSGDLIRTIDARGICRSRRWFFGPLCNDCLSETSHSGSPENAWLLNQLENVAFVASRVVKQSRSRSEVKADSNLSLPKVQIRK